MSKRKKITLIIPLVISSFILVLSIWCSRPGVPSAPKLGDGLTFGGVDVTKEYRNEESITAGTITRMPLSELTFVKLPPAPTINIKGKKNETHVQGEVTVKNGAHLKIDYRQPLGGHDADEDDFENKLRIKINLRAHPHSVSRDNVWSMSLDTEYLMFVLEPKGLEFLKPVELRIKTQNINLSELDPATIGLYYYDEYENIWKLMESIRLEVDVTKGSFNGCWYIEHFSRYAIASR